MAYQRFGGWYDGNNDALVLDNTQTGLQHSDRLDVMGTGTINIDDNRQLQLVTQYYKSRGDDYGLYLGKNMSAVTGEGKAYTTDGLNSDRVHGTERHLISLQYSDADFYGQNLVSQIYYRDESLTFTPSRRSPKVRSAASPHLNRIPISTVRRLPSTANRSTAGI